MRFSPKLSLTPCILCVVSSTALFASLLAAAASNNPIPQVVGPPVPQAVIPGSGAFTLAVYGANFVQGAVVNWNRSPRSTTFISAHELQAQILASDVANPTAGYITVTNPPPGGGVSSSSYGLVEVHEPASTIVAKRTQVLFAGNGSAVLDLADFNNDGILDFAAEAGDATIKVFLGNGDGTFRFGSIATNNYYGSGPAAIASGDFNNDGNEDLAFGADWTGPPTQVGVNLGEGNGKFRYGSRFGYFPNLFPFVIAVGDFNRDGNLDLATVPGTGIGTDLAVFLGNGDGTFKRLVNYSVAGVPMFTADFNGAGILDLVFLRDYAIYVMLGNGDGTFQKPQEVISSTHQIGNCGFGQVLFVTDFNADGNADLAYCERDYPANRGKIWIALGNGDGTFKKPVSITVHPYQGAFSFAVGDFNSDGKTDLLANYWMAGNPNKTETDLFLGNGDGTFQPRKIINLGREPYNAEEGIVTADFNSGGLLDFIFQQPGEVDVFVQK